MSTTQPLTLDQQALVERYHRFTLALITPFVEQWPTYSDELESRALYQLCRVAARWDPRHQKQASFATYLRWRVIGACIDTLRAEARRHARLTYAPVDEWPIEHAGSGDRSGEVAEGLDHLAPLERRVFERRVLEGLTVRQTAQALGLSESRVSRITAEAYSALRERRRAC